MEALDYAQSHPSESCRKLSLKFAIGKTQIALLIEEKMEALDYAQSHPSESCRKLSLKFAIGKTQIANLLRNESKI